MGLPRLQCLGDPPATILPSLKGRADSPSGSLQQELPPPPPNLGLQNSEPSGEMKGWLANHSEDRLQRQSRGSRALLSPQQDGQVHRLVWLEVGLGGSSCGLNCPSTSVFSSVKWES